MSRFRWILAVMLSFALATNVALAQGQGKGKAGEKKDAYGKAEAKSDQGKPQKAQDQKGKPDHAGKADQRGKPDQAGKSDKAQGKGAVRTVSKGSMKHSASVRDLQPSMRKYAASSRVPERVAAGALARAFTRGIDNDDLIITSAADRVRVKNKKGDVLIDLDDNRARNLGAWNVNVLRNESKSGSPSFCRSGAGHPNWGRQWCVDKGFGLGSNNDIRWGRSTSIGDIIFGRRIVDRETLLRDALVSTLGNVVLDRLGLHSLTLGYTEPLSGVWVAQPTGPQVMLVNSGTYPVAELVDLDRDNRADVMFFALRPY